MPNIIFFREFLWNLLPPWFEKGDTYLDINNEGLVRRYLRNIGMELDEGFYPFIKYILDILDTRLTPENLLVFLSSNLGYIPNFNAESDVYRLIIAYAAQIYKLKGSRLSFELLYWILGYYIELFEEVPERPYAYDKGFYYDVDGFYDTDCQWCSGFWIKIRPINPVDNFTITPELEDTIQKICDFLRPINAICMGAIEMDINWIYYGWVDNISQVQTFAGITALQHKIAAPINPNDINEIICDFTPNTQFKILVMAKPTIINTMGLWSVVDHNLGFINQNPKDLFKIHTKVPTWEVYYTNYKTKQVQNPISFFVL